MLLRLLILSVLAAPLTNAGIRWMGARPAEAGDLERRVSEFERSSERPAADSLTAWLVDLGYWDAIVRVDSGSLIATIGQQVVLQSIEFGDDTASVGEPFSAEVLENGIRTILNVFQDSGHYYARAQVEQVMREGNDVRVRVWVQPGPLVRISAIDVTGLTRTDVALIRRTFGIYVGRPLTASLIASAQADFERLDFVVPVDSIQVQPDPGYTTARLGLTVRERPQARIFGGGGLQGDAPRTVVWQADLGFANPFGDGRSFEIHSSRPDRGRSRLSFRYSQPLFLLGRNRLELTLTSRSYDSLYTEIEPAMRLSGSLAPRLTGGVGGYYRRVDHQTAVPDSRSFGAELFLDRDLREPFRNPATGSRLKGRVAYAYRRLLSDRAEVPDRTTHDTRTELRLESWSSHIRPFTVFIAADYRGLETAETDLAVSELFLIGGPGSLRGYRNEQFAVQRAVIGTLEIRRRFELSFIGLFWDGGYLDRPSAGPNSPGASELYRQGFGLVVAIGDLTRQVRVSLAWSPDLTFDQPRLGVEFEQNL